MSWRSWENLNNSWYLNNNPELGLNPRLKYVNSNSDEENKALIKWANENRIGLVDLDDYSDYELKRERRLYRCHFKNALADCIDYEMDDICLRGFGTLEENKLFKKIYEEYLSHFREIYADQIRYEEECREEERRAELRSLGMDPDCPWRSV